MAPLILYIIKSIVASGILYGYYQLVLKNKKFHSYNRFYLLCAICISLVVPFVNFDFIYLEAGQVTPFHDLVNNVTAPVQKNTVGLILTAITLSISFSLLVILAAKIGWVLRIKSNSQQTRMNGFTLIETDAKQAPFSFFSNLFWKRGLSATTTNGEKIFRHELTHIKQKHTYDKLFAQVILCLCWFNPFYWLIQKELNTIHEFIADAASIEDGDTESFAKMLLHVHNEGSYLTPSHTFFNSSIKRRLLMISSSNNTRYSYVRRILALPVALCVLATISVKLKAQAEVKPVPAVAVEVRTATDTVPKTVPAEVTVVGTKKKISNEPVTVVGYKREGKPAQITTASSASEVKEVTVVGHKIGSKPAKTATTTPSEEIKEVTVVGYKIGSKPAETTTATPEKKEVKPVTVTGRKKEN